MDLYSLTLGSAMAFVGAAAVAALSAWRARRTAASERAAAWRGRARLGAFAGLLTAAFALGLHLLTGHRPGSPDAMSAADLVLEHPALFAVLAVALALLAWTRPRPHGD